MVNGGPRVKARTSLPLPSLGWGTGERLREGPQAPPPRPGNMGTPMGGATGSSPRMAQAGPVRHVGTHMEATHFLTLHT